MDYFNEAVRLQNVAARRASVSPISEAFRSVEFLNQLKRRHMRDALEVIADAADGYQAPDVALGRIRREIGKLVEIAALDLKDEQDWEAGNDL